MATERSELRWSEIWAHRRQRCLAELSALRSFGSREARAIVAESRALAASPDPLVHASADVERLTERVNALEGRLPIELHGPVCNGLSMLRIAAQEAVAASTREVTPSGGSPPVRRQHPRSQRFEWFLVVARDGEELVELVEDCSRELTEPLPVRSATTLEEARAQLARRDGAGIVVTNLTLSSAGGVGPHGLQVAAEAHRRRHAVVLVTAAGDYLEYWRHLPDAGLTGHHVVVKTRRDFASRLRSRARAIAEPAPLTVAYDEDTGHVVWIGDVEVSRLEGQEALVLRVLDGTWQTPQVISDACRDSTDLAPRASGVPPVISALRRKLSDAMVAAESANAQGELIESRRRDGLPAQYRLAPWLRWDDPPEPVAVAGALPAVLVVEDDPDWALWIESWLARAGWRVDTAGSAAAAERALAGDELPILVVDLALRSEAAGVPDIEEGLRFVEDVAGRRHGVRVVIVSAFGGRDTLRSRLFEAGVRTVDVIDKAAGRDECGAMLLASLQRAADESRRGVRRARESAPAHRVVRLDRRRLEVDGHPVPALSEREADVFHVLIERANQAVKAELLEYLCFPANAQPGSGARYNPLNKVHLTISRMRRKIDRATGREGAGRSLVRTPRRGARTAYELHGQVTDLLDSC